jgi:FAD binding domain-containing protein
MRVSQVIIEPVLRAAVANVPLVTARYGVTLEEAAEDDDGVTAVLRNVETGGTETVRCAYLAGCDGGGSRVRDCLGIGFDGQHAVMQRYMIHFRSQARDILQPFGVTWHYQTSLGTLIAQDDDVIWTLQTRPDPGEPPEARTSSCWLPQPLFNSRPPSFHCPCRLRGSTVMPVFLLRMPPATTLALTLPTPILSFRALRSTIASTVLLHVMPTSLVAYTIMLRDPNDDANPVCLVDLSHSRRCAHARCRQTQWKQCSRDHERCSHGEPPL